MEDFNRIGLNIWGIRGGYRSFCHTENIDVETPEIKNTWKDIREFVYVTDLTVRFYALEFTPDYKVFTIYRPENDTSRTGAYVATTIYVPHDLKINRILDVMRQISDAYHKDHYDAFGNPNTNPDYIQSYAQLLKNYAGNVVREGDMRSWESSAQDNTPRIMPFTSIAVVEDFFDKPYRKEFLKHQEVMFWDVDCLQNQQSHGVKFQKMESLSSLFETDGRNIAPQFEGGSIKNKPQEGVITQFVREGVDVTPNWQSSFYYDKTHIAITLKKPFHQPLSYQGPMIGVGSPFVKRGDDYEFSPRLMFTPRQYEIPVNVANVGNSPFTLYFGNQRVDIRDGRGVFKFDGSQANGACKVTLRPDGVNEIKVTDFAMSKFFAPGSDEPDRLQPCIIDSLKTVRFQFNQECKGKLKLRWSDVFSSFSTVNKTFETVMPAQSKVADFEINVDGYKAEVKATDADSNTFEVTLTRESLVVDIIVPEALRRYVFSDSFVLKVGGKSYKGTHVVVPFAERDSQWSLSLAVDNRGNTLACEYERKPNFDDVVLCPKLAVLANRTNDTLQMTSPTFEVYGNSTVLVPAGYEVKLKGGDKYDVDVFTDSMGIKMNTITLKAGFASTGTTSTTTGGYQGGYQGGGSSSGGAKDNKKYFGLYWYEDKECKLFENAVTKIFADGSLATMIDGRECILFFDKERRPVADKQKKHDAANKKNGFKVTVVNGRCSVESTLPKPKIGRGGGGNNGNGGDDGGKRKRWFLFGGLFGAVLLLGGLVWLAIELFDGKNKPVYAIKVGMDLDTKIDSIHPDYKGKDRTYIKKDPKDANTIFLFEGWEGVDIKIYTIGEGNCDKITIENSANGVKFEERDFYRVDTTGNNMTLNVTSPAWMELFGVIESDDKEAIIKYGSLIKDRSSDKFVEKCIEEAYNRVKGDDPETIQTFITQFEKCGKAGDKIEMLKNKLSGMQQEKEKLEEQNRLYQEFSGKLDLVYSINCTKTNVNNLTSSYKGIINKGDHDLITRINALIVYKYQLPSKTDIIKWMEKLGASHNEIFSFASNNKVDQGTIEWYLKNSSYFSPRQREALEKLKECFGWYKTYYTKRCKEDKCYKYILDNYNEAKEATN